MRPRSDIDMIIALVALPIHAVVSGIAISYLWLWFVVPFGVPAIGIVHGIGLDLVGSAIAGGIPDSDRSGAEMAVLGFFVPTAILIFGAIVQAFM